MAERAFLVTALGNEAPYLLEWVAHHRALGFEGAVLFTYGAEDGTAQMAARLEELGHARHIPLELKTWRDPLRYGLRDLLPRLDQIGADWAMVAEIDEFLDIRTKGGGLVHFLAKIGPADAVSVCRRVFGSGGRRGLPEGTIRDSYTMAAPEEERGPMVGRGLKTLFRPGKVSRVAPHRPYFRDGPDSIRWLDAGGQPMPERYFEGQWSAHKGFSHKYARLNYIALPSPEAFLLRRGVPESEDERKTRLKDWLGLDTNAAAAPMSKAVERAAPVLEALQQDSALAGLERDGRAWHEERIARMLQDEETARLCDEMAAGCGPDAAPAPAPQGPEREDAEAPPAPVRNAPRGGGGTYAPPPVRPVRFDVKPSKDGQSHAVLHGGFHKTATTHIQKLLENNEAFLGRQSVYVVPHQKLRKHITFPSQLEAYRGLNIHRRTKFTEEELQGFADAFFAEPLALRPRRMILSDENIPGLPAHCVTDGGLYMYRKPFFDCFAKRLPLPVTEAFFAIRTYADFFASAYVEYLRAATATTSGRMITPEEMRRNVLAKLPGWQAVLADFATAFPGARIHVWRFEDFRALRARILELFCGEGVDVAKLKDKTKNRTRPTASARAVEELVLISELEGASAMAERAREVQDRFPLEGGHDRFDPWSAEERAHLDRLYERDWQEICRDPRFSAVLPGA